MYQLEYSNIYYTYYKLGEKKQQNGVMDFALENNFE